MTSQSTAKLDSADRIEELRETIRRKGALRSFYDETYRLYAGCLSRCPGEGLVVELGSGGGFASQRIPGLLTTDVLPYAGIDRVVDATRMPFADQSIRALFMMNVFHHIPDAAAFLREAQRCLVPGGRVLIVDHHLGWLGSFILRFLHHEPFAPGSVDWSFPSRGPLSDANTALAWMVFTRDRARFENAFTELDIASIAPHSSLFYWLSGGLKGWSLLPPWGWSLRAARALDSLILRIFGSGAATYETVEIIRREGRASL